MNIFMQNRFLYVFLKSYNVFIKNLFFDFEVLIINICIKLFAICQIAGNLTNFIQNNVIFDCVIWLNFVSTQLIVNKSKYEFK